MTEAALISGCINKHPLAQRELYNHFSPKMLGLCYRYATNKEDAEEMLQEGFIKVFTKIESFEGKGSFEGWIRRIMIHTCINYLKRTRKINDFADVDAVADVPVAEESVFSWMQSKQVTECIRQLPLGFKTVLNLYAVEGYSHKEIAILLDINESTSRSQYLRARNALMNMLIQQRIVNTKESFFKTSKQTILPRTQS